MRHALTNGLLEALTGLIFSILISLAIVLGLYFNLAPFKAIERSGRDTAMRLISLVPPDSTGTRKYAFVDIDRQTCLAFTTDRESCWTENPVQGSFVLPFVTGLIGSTVDVVLVDKQIDLRNPADAALVDGLAAASRRPGAPWIILPLLVRPQGDGSYRAVNREWFEPAWREQHALENSRLRYAVFLAETDGAAGDGKVRTFRPFVTVAHDKLACSVPTAPLLAHLLQSGGRDAGQMGSPDACRHEGQVAARPTLFALPALSQSGIQPDIAERFDDFYRHKWARDTLDGQRISYRPFDGDGAVTLILGSSLESANDLHLAAVGTMSGPEIILNEIDSLQTERPLHDADDSYRIVALFMEKAWVAFQISLLIFLPLYVLAGFANIVLAEKLSFWRNTPFLRYAISAAAVGLGLYLGIKFEISYAVRLLSTEAREGNVIDVITPIVALGIEIYTDTAKRVLQAIEVLVHHILKMLGLGGHEHA